MGMSIKLKIILVTLSLLIVTSLVVGLSVESMSRRLNDTGGIDQDARNQTLAVIGGVFLAGAALTIIFSFRITSPVDKLIIGTQLVAAGNLDHRIKKSSNDEIGRLVDSFNQMIAKLRRSKEQSSRYSNIATVEKQKAELIIDSMADGVIVTDSRHNIVLLNPAAEKLFDIDSKNVIGRSIVNMLKKFRIESLFEDFPDISDRMLPVRKSNIRIREFEIQNPAKKIIKTTIAPLKDEGNMIIGTVAVFVDITKMRELDRMKTEFVSTVSHELRTPLTSIKGYAALLGDSRLGKLNEKQKKSAEIISKESDRLAGLINDILDLSRLEAGKAKTTFVMTDLRECLEESRMLNLAKARNISVNIIMPENLPKMLLDRAKIIQVFTNLLSNAIKFTKPGGKIVIKATNRRDEVLVDISDTGIGIPKKEIPKLFNKFYQVESHLTRNQSGTGLGLPIVKEIIGLHHGLVSVKSRVHKGTTISFSLPKYPFSEEELISCWEKRNCKKVKCPAYQNDDKRCWLFIGTLCRKNTNEPCLDKIDICRHCDIYKKALEDEQKK